MPIQQTACLLVLNFRRPSTPNPETAMEMVRKIEAVGRQKVTGLISNTHLMDETSSDVVLAGHAMARETGDRLDIPVVAVAAGEDLADEISALVDCQVIRLRRIVVPPFEIPKQRTTGPLFVVN